MAVHTIYVGCAGWRIPREHATWFPTQGTHLERYAARFPAVEINSSFYRLHRPSTYRRWAGSTPPGFRFAVKLFRQLTHGQRLRHVAGLDAFLEGVEALGEKLGPLLVQLPPSLEFDPLVAQAFFRALRARFRGWVACEPRHPTWFTPEAEALLVRHRVARVAADPPPAPDGDRPGGWVGLSYWRLHGSPRRYYDPYDPARLVSLAQELRRAAERGPVWCIFNNTAAGAALPNAWALLQELDPGALTPGPGRGQPG